ncbi:unnamed protein product [Allacma fusca]|uniref:Uncharacterized protein n=1 Tax=Allacma fusca TaxID=39272 RepID=A0A8J2PEF5_9HEXA|nr:unnamed protein product [Allacma fusca]
MNRFTGGFRVNNSYRPNEHQHWILTKAVCNIHFVHCAFLLISKSYFETWGNRNNVQYKSHEPIDILMGSLGLHSVLSRCDFKKSLWTQPL